MRMRALDSFATSGVGMVHAGQEFEIDSDVRGKELEKRGLAKAIAAAPQNKMEPAAENKGEPIAGTLTTPESKKPPARKASAKKKG